MKAVINICFLFLSFMMVACSAGKTGSMSTEAVAVGAGATDGVQRPARALPKAVIYRTNGDYVDHVPVNVDDSHKALLSYPAPSDISKRSVPVDLGEGWLFDRRGGVGLNTVFLTYTYDEYAALKSAPSPGALMEAVIPGSEVTQCITTPVLFNEAVADPEILKKYIPR